MTGIHTLTERFARTGEFDSKNRAQLPISVAATSTALPGNVVEMAQVKAYLDIVFPLSESRRATMLEVIENTKIDRRYTIFPAAYTVQPRSLEQTSREYLEHSVLLGRRAAADCLTNAGLKATDIDLLITVSCTGIMIPSLDAHLINDLGFRNDVRRLPITELGCAAGAAALGRAWDFLRGVETGNVLIVAVELPSLTFQRQNISPANMVSSALFGDGAAATIVTRGAAPAAGNGPRILGSQSHLFPNTIDAMGFELKEGGLHIVLSKDVPQLIRDVIRELVDKFLGTFRMKQSDLSAFVLHPGGQKLLQFMEEELGLDRSMTQYSWDTLRDYGNLSSASVLFVLQEWLTKGNVAPGERGLLAAFGPGFSAEMLMLEWA
jgi:alkylresorcinol/alkylpyrone synthase